MICKKGLQQYSSMDNILTMSQPRHSKFEKKTDYATTLQRLKSNLVFEEKALSPKKSDEAEESSSFSNTTTCNKYQIFFIVKNETTPLEITCNFHKDSSIKEAILQVLKLFNQELKKKSLVFSLNEDAQYWEFRFARKNGFPKTDYPALDEYNSAYNIGSTSLTLCCKDLTNGMVNTQETSPSSCSIRAEMDFKGTAITGCYENSLTASRKTEVVVRKKEIEMKKPKKKSKFCLFTFFCL